MKSYRIVSLVVLALVGFWYAVDTRTKDPSNFYITMIGHPTHAAGALTDNTMRLSVPVHVPRAILPAGTYRFRFLTPTLVQVTSLDGTRMYGTFTTVPVTRNIPPNRGQVRFQNVGIDRGLPAHGRRSLVTLPRSSPHSPLIGPSVRAF